MLLSDIQNLNSKIEEILKIRIEYTHLSLGQVKILKIIYESETNKINALEIEKKSNKDKRQVSLNLKKLENLEYIQRESLGGDKRKKNIFLTEYALEMVEDIISIEDELNDLLQSILDKEGIYEQETKNLYLELQKRFEKE